MKLVEKFKLKSFEIAIIFDLTVDIYKTDN